MLCACHHVDEAAAQISGRLSDNMLRGYRQARGKRNAELRFRWAVRETLAHNCKRCMNAFPQSLSGIELLLVEAVAETYSLQHPEIAEPIEGKQGLIVGNRPASRCTKSPQQARKSLHGFLGQPTNGGLDQR